jgi:DNA-binding transcriptional MerR regulator
MRISKASKLSGATPKAIRLYESLGLLATVKRAGTYRIYTQRDIALIRLIKKAQRLGFRLSELKLSFAKSGFKAASWKTLVRLLQEKESEIIREMTRLEKLRASVGDCRKEIEDCLAKNPDCAQPVY